MIKKDLKKGFSLAELLVVMVVAAIVLAVSAPMITRKASNANLGAEAVFAPINDLVVRYVSGKDQRIYLPDGNSGTGIVGKDKEIPKKSVVLGTFTQLPKEDAISIGYNTALRKGSIVIGNNSKTTDNATTEPSYSIVIGNNSEAFVHSAIAIGNEVKVENSDIIAIGEYATAKGYIGVALGHRANVEGNGAVAIGPMAEAKGANGVALGIYSKANNLGAIAIGEMATASKENTPSVNYNKAVAIGYYANNKGGVGNSSVAIGTEANAGEVGAISIGYKANNYFNTTVKDMPAARAIAIGSEANAGQPDAIAVGSGANVSGNNGIAIGNHASVWPTATRSVAIGNKAVATKPNTIVLGTADDTVIIPGNLVVDYRTLLGSKTREEPAGTIMTCIGEHGDSKDIVCVQKISSAGMVVGMSGDYTVGPYTVTSGFSDRRLKNVGDKFTGGLDELNKLDLYHYTYKDDKDKTPHVGVMAQDLQKVFPDAVTEGKDGFLRIRMEDMFYAVINAVKELHQKVAAVCANVEQLTKDFGDMQTQLTEQKKINETQTEQIEELRKMVEEQNKQIVDLQKQVKKIKK